MKLQRRKKIKLEKKDYKIYNFLENFDIKKFFCILIFYNIIGIFVNYIDPFPLYGYFASLFNLIILISTFSIRYFLRQMNLILIKISGEPKFRNAKYTYEKIKESKIIFGIPIVVMIVYMGTGLPMIKPFQLSYSMIFALAAFIPSVYFSILVYIQYIALAVFVYKAYECNDKYLSYMEQCPAHSDILYLLSELLKYYRNSFFVIGTSYIAAFGLFTLSNSFGIDMSAKNYGLILGWGIIAIAIVFVFPVISYLEKRWMFSIIRDLKIISTKKIQKDFKENNGDKIQASNLIISIWQTPDYPIKEPISLGYGIITTMVNLITMLYYANELFIS